MVHWADQPPVIAGVDGSIRSRLVVRMAAAEAALRGAPLHVVMTVPAHRHAAPHTLHGSRARAAEQELIASAGAELPTDRVFAETIPGHPVDVLTDLSYGAALIVVGHRGRAALTAAVRGSVGIDVAARAHCPVLLVAETAGDPAAAGGTRPVVLGLDNRRDSPALLTAGFAAARARRAPLHVVHVWAPAMAMRPTGMPRDCELAAERAEALDVLRRLVVSERASHPTVEVEERVLPGEPGPVLVALSADAQLLVVGSRGRSARSGLLLGSVSQAALRGAHCPVLVVPPGARIPGPRTVRTEASRAVPTA
jgi:nucleotide-binding universal stress UspA family protein